VSFDLQVTVRMLSQEKNISLYPFDLFVFLICLPATACRGRQPRLHDVAATQLTASPAVSRNYFGFGGLCLDLGSDQNKFLDLAM